jgi:hypothetical protein
VLSFKSRRVTRFPVLVIQATGILKAADLPRISAYARERAATAQSAVFDMRGVVPLFGAVEELCNPAIEPIPVPVAIVVSPAHVNQMWDHVSAMADRGYLRHVFTEQGDAIFWACEQTRRWPLGYWVGLPSRQTVVSP